MQMRLVTTCLGPYIQVSTIGCEQCINKNIPSLFRTQLQRKKKLNKKTKKLFFSLIKKANIEKKPCIYMNRAIKVYVSKQATICKWGYLQGKDIYRSWHVLLFVWRHCRRPRSRTGAEHNRFSGPLLGTRVVCGVWPENRLCSARSLTAACDS